jgi:hypothetical protein
MEPFRPGDCSTGARRGWIPLAQRTIEVLEMVVMLATLGPILLRGQWALVSSGSVTFLDSVGVSPIVLAGRGDYASNGNYVIFPSIPGFLDRFKRARSGLRTSATFINFPPCNIKPYLAGHDVHASAWHRPVWVEVLNAIAEFLGQLQRGRPFHMALGAPHV